MGCRNIDTTCCNVQNKGQLQRIIDIEYLFLDLNTCERCISTDRQLEAIIDKLNPMFEMAGYKIHYRKIEIKTKELAQKYYFHSSPTIRINGYDAFPRILENSCASCSSISGAPTCCRAYEVNGAIRESPTDQMIAEAILKNAMREKRTPGGEYELPRNLVDFFNGKEAGRA